MPISVEEREFMAAFGIPVGTKHEDGFKKAIEEYEQAIDALAQARKHLVEATPMTQQFADRIEGIVLRARLRVHG